MGGRAAPARKASPGFVIEMAAYAAALHAAHLSDLWYPGRLNTLSSAMEQGAATIGRDLLRNPGSEFRPDLKHKLLRRR